MSIARALPLKFSNLGCGCRAGLGVMLSWDLARLRVFSQVSQGPVSREGIRVWRARRCSIILILRFVVSTKPFLLVLSNFFCILLEIVSGSLHYFSFLDIFRKSQSKLKMSKQSKLNTRDIDRA